MGVKIVITSIAQEPTEGIREFDDKSHGATQLLVIGDKKSPARLSLKNGEFYNVERQQQMPFNYSKISPFNHYCRKNIGYLLAMKSGVDIIVDTDDDNIPYDSFWEPREVLLSGDFVTGPGWFNVYNQFGAKGVWPRGLPLTEVKSQHRHSINCVDSIRCPVQQCLANENPDVDAVFRLTRELPIQFKKRVPVILGRNVWCPFNSQATFWFREAFPLMYLPATCTFRMTDIWRSFIAQRILWENEAYVAFLNAVVRQERNVHDLMVDFEDELPGFLGNNKIRDILNSLKLKSGKAKITSNLMMCYKALIQHGYFGGSEIELLNAWIKDIEL